MGRERTIGRVRPGTRSLLAGPVQVDVQVFLLVALSMTVEFVALRGPLRSQVSNARQTLWSLLVISIAVSMLFRRVAPFIVLTVATACTFSLILLIGSFWWPSTGQWSLYVATYSVASLRGPKWAVAGVALGTCAVIPIEGVHRVLGLIVLLSLLSLAAIGGLSTRAGRRLIDEIRSQAVLLGLTREARMELALEEERSRVARELHDVVAHGVTLMVVHAGAARMTAERDEQQVGEILRRMMSTADETRAELRSLMHSVGSDGAMFGPLIPQADFDIPALIESGRAAGLAIDFDVSGDARPMDPALQMSLYRIVQEGLTNVTKHAPGALAQVALRYLTFGVEVKITNPPAPLGSHDVVGFGRGLIGIRERAALFGGEASATRLPGGGFRLSVRIPSDPERVRREDEDVESLP
jgi:signal transduction histidine kinase